MSINIKLSGCIILKMVAPAGIEPATQGFSVPCSTDWAMKPNNMAVSTGLEPAIFCVTGRRVNQLHHETTFGCGKRIWTSDLRVMSPTSYRAAPSRDLIWRRKRDSNPCAACTTCRFSRPIPSTRLGYSSVCIVFFFRRQIDYSIVFLWMSTFFYRFPG